MQVRLLSCPSRWRSRRAACRPAAAPTSVGTPPAAEEGSPKKLACRLHNQQQGQVVGMVGPVPRVQLHASMPRQVMMCTCALPLPPLPRSPPTARSKTLARQDARGRRSLYAINNAPPGFVRHLPAPAVGCWNGRAAGHDRPSASATAFMVEAVPMVLQCPAEGALLQAHAAKFFLVDFFACSQLAAAAPDDGA